MEKQFKALMNLGQYVDANRLEKGIYFSHKPFIYSKDDTIEALISAGMSIKDMGGLNFLSERYFENLKKCQLVSISITVNPH